MEALGIIRLNWGKKAADEDEKWKGRGDDAPGTKGESRNGDGVF